MRPENHKDTLLCLTARTYMNEYISMTYSLSVTVGGLILPNPRTMLLLTFGVVVGWLVGGMVLVKLIRIMISRKRI